MTIKQTELIPLIFFINDLERLLRRNRLTLRRMWCRGDFPIPSGRINNRLYWKADAINQWINNK
jgi:prophage regulatory protein